MCACFTGTPRLTDRSPTAAVPALYQTPPLPPPPPSLPKNETQPPPLQTRPGPSHATASCRKNRHGVRQSSLCPGNRVQATASDQGAEEVPVPLLFGFFSKRGVLGRGGGGAGTGSGVSHTTPQCSDIIETGSPDRTRSLGVRAGLRAPHTHAPPRSLSFLYETARSWESDPAKPLAFVLLHSRSSKRRKTLKRFFFYGAREVREYFHGPSTTRRLCRI